MSLSLSNISPYRDAVRVGVLRNKIAEIDTYTHLTPSDKSCEAYCFGGRFAKTPIAYITTQLQLILSLEDELDAELNKPIEHPDVAQEDTSTTNYRDYRLILNLQSRIDNLDRETDEEISDCESRCCGTTAYLLPTNTMLTKQILQKRLRREMRKENGGHYNYEATPEPMAAGPSSSSHDDVYHASQQVFDDHHGEELKPLNNIAINPLRGIHIKPAFISVRFTTSDSNEPDYHPISQPSDRWRAVEDDGEDEEERKRQSKYQNGVVIDDLRRNIARLECDPKLEGRFKTMGAVAFVYSIYNTVKAQDLKNKLRKELAKPINEEPPSYED